MRRSGIGSQLCVDFPCHDISFHLLSSNRRAPLDPAVKPSYGLQVCALLREKLLWIARVRADRETVTSARIQGRLPRDASLVKGLLGKRASLGWIRVVVVCSC